MQTIRTHQDFYTLKFSADSNRMFKYIFDTFKKSIFVQIKRGKVAHFLNLDNQSYENSWHSRVNFDEFKITPEIQDPPKWFANNYLVRFEKPFSESTIGRLELLDMFNALCETFDLGKGKTLEFFVNRRDFPLLRRDGKHPYAAIYGQNEPSGAPKCAVKLLSMVSSPDFCDIPIPTPDDWSRVSGKDFSETKRTKAAIFKDEFTTPWNSKKSIAVFRGGPTGYNFGAQRVELCAKVLRDPRFDAKLTSEPSRVQIVNCAVKHPPKFSRDLLGAHLSLAEQSGYKFIIHVQGHVQAYRLSSELATRSVILLVDSETKLWFENKLQPWTHYVPVSRDLSDLEKQLDWCMSNDETCKRIAANARDFYDRYLGKKACLEYLSAILGAEVPRDSPKERRDIDAPILGESRSYLKIICSKFSEMKLGPVLRRSDKYVLKVLGDGAAMRKEFKFPELLKREVEISFWTNKLVEEIPNFLYTFKDTETSFVQDSFSKFLTLDEYIKSQAFRFSVFLNILKQSFLALEHARAKCLFIHGNLEPANVLLYRTYPRDYDYVTVQDSSCAKFTTWRVRVDNYIPVFFDYSTSSVLESSQASDAATLLAKSLQLSLYHRKLSSTQTQETFNLFGATFAAKTPKELVAKVYARTVPTVSAVELFSKINDANFLKVSGVKYTHFGKVSSVYSYPSQDIPLIKRYHQQLLSRMTQGGYSESLVRGLEPARNLARGWTMEFGGAKLDRKYIEPLNICIGLLTDDSDFRLDEEEKKELLEKIRPALDLGFI